MQKKGIACRLARRSDIPDLVRFQLGCAADSEGLALDPAACRRGVTGFFDHPSRGRYFVCERDGRVAGCLLIQYEWCDWRDGLVWWIHSVFVEASLRGQGLYAAMYEHVRALAAAEPKVVALRLYVDRRNARAQAAYAGLGMSKDHYELFEWTLPRTAPTGGR